MIVTEIAIPPESFEYSEILQTDPEAKVELEHLSFNGGYAPLVWLSGEDRKAVVAAAREHPLIDDVIRHQSTEDRTLVEVFLEPRRTGVMEALHQSNAKVFDVVGTNETWKFRLGFSAHGDLTTFQSLLSEFDVPMTLRSLSELGLEPGSRGSGDRPALSSEQREAVLLAKEHGYFDVPRQTTTADLADELGISDSAFSQRIRRGLDAVLDDSLESEGVIRE